MKNIPPPESTETPQSSVDWRALSSAFRHTAALMASFNANPLGYVHKQAPNTFYPAVASLEGFTKVFSEHQVRGMETALVDAVHRVDSLQSRVSNLLNLLEAEMWQTRELRAEIARLQIIQHSTPVKPFRRTPPAADS